MLDRSLRAVLARPLEVTAAALDRPGITPDRLTVLGLALGVASAVTAGFQLWWVALVLWLVSRIADGLDACLLYTSPSPRDRQKSRMPSSA